MFLYFGMDPDPMNGEFPLFFHRILFSAESRFDIFVVNTYLGIALLLLPLLLLLLAANLALRA